jgi:hypothetical protein
MRQRLAKEQDGKAVAGMRNCREYKDSHDQISKQLGGLSTMGALDTCKAQGK